MKKLQRTFAAITAVVLVAGCQENPAAPRDAGAALLAPHLTIALDPTLVTYNSASCTLGSTSTGSVSCSWDITNPGEVQVNFSVQAMLEASYDCVNPKSGRVSSSEVRDIWTSRMESGVSSASLTGNNVALPPPFLPTNYTGAMKKQNACKGNNLVANLTWSLPYWEFGVASVGGAQRLSCFALDNRAGCYTL